MRRSVEEMWKARMIVDSLRKARSRLLVRTLERSEKQQLEKALQKHVQTCQQLSEANNALSARTLTLAEASSTAEAVRNQLETKLAETRAALEAARNEMDEMRMTEQTQRIMLMDELNTTQSENASLKAQLRARK